MFGRIDYAVDYLMKKYNLQLNQEVSTYQLLITALANNVGPEDQPLCRNMLEAAERATLQVNKEASNPVETDNERRLGREDAAFVFKNCARPEAHLFRDTDFSEERQTARRRRNKEAMRNLMLFLLLIGVILLCVWIYNLDYFAEKRDYKKLEQAVDAGYYYGLQEEVDAYMLRYPDSERRGEVLFMPVQAATNMNDIDFTMDAIARYLQADPDGKYAEEARMMERDIWNREIEKYKVNGMPNATPEGAEFMINMLYYMRDNNLRTINVAIEPVFNLKDYSEYSRQVRNYVEMFSYDPMLKVPENLTTIKDKVTREQALDWGDYLVNDLRAGFSSVLGSGFIQFERIDGEPAGEELKNPVITMTLTVTNQETNGIPDIWVFGNSIFKTSSALYLGLAIDFKSEFTFPGNKKPFIITGEGNAGLGEIKNIEREEIYDRMGQRCTETFSEETVKALGLEARQSYGGSGYYSSEFYDAPDSVAYDSY